MNFSGANANAETPSEVRIFFPGSDGELVVLFKSSGSDAKLGNKVGSFGSLTILCS